MKLHRTGLALAALLGATFWLVTGCSPAGQSSTAASSTAASHSIPAGTHIQVRLGSSLSSETAHVGDGWQGTVAASVVAPDGARIPAGSSVSGRVAAVTAAQRGARAMLRLELTGIRADGEEHAVTASANAVIAGSTRKRNVGAIAGGALAGALIGKVVGDGRNATAGAVIGGAAATGVVAESKGFQVVLSDGAVMRFTVRQSVAMR